MTNQCVARLFWVIHVIDIDHCIGSRRCNETYYEHVSQSTVICHNALRHTIGVSITRWQVGYCIDILRMSQVHILLLKLIFLGAIPRTNRLVSGRRDNHVVAHGNNGSDLNEKVEHKYHWIQKLNTQHVRTSNSWPCKEHSSLYWLLSTDIMN